MCDSYSTNHHVQHKLQYAVKVSEFFMDIAKSLFVSYLILLRGFFQYILILITVAKEQELVHAFKISGELINFHKCQRFS
ncbi:hypothetical protein SAMN05444506_101513 [Pseudomonas syringae]|nr:hypothetical protein SAMN05444506_101513 [Pseudomonas syringae]